MADMGSCLSNPPPAILRLPIIKPMVSIIIPTKNEEKNLPFILRSIQAQTFKDVEVIVADAGSTDQTRAIAASFGARVIEGGLPGTGRNRGAAAAKGDILIFFDADIVLPDPWFLQATIAEFEKRGLGLATCKMDPLSSKFVDKAMHEVFNFFMWVASGISPHAPGFCIFARRSIHEAIGGFDEEIRLAEDHDYVARGAKYGKFGILKSYRIPVSVRRMERDGRFNIAMKYILAELYMQTHGQIKTDVFNYQFAHYDGQRGKKLSREEFKRRLEAVLQLAKEDAKASFHMTKGTPRKKAAKKK